MSEQLFTEHTELRERASAFFKHIQQEITSTLASLDGVATFREDNWERPGGGGGRTRVIADGSVFEKGGVNFSAVHGNSPQYLTKGLGEHQFFATGTSLVIHPHSPKVPTIHANFRFFQQSNGEVWFGGGIDLTPYYLDVDDAAQFHSLLKQVCDRHDPFYYSRFKKWCDEYFYIKHRAETRGIGGLFFDHLTGNTSELEKVFDFVQDVGEHFLKLYVPIVEKHRHESFTEDEKRWQLLRRGRYVEFNLVYDKGTLFGLETNGRIESILMSLPTVARWEYDYSPLAGSPEADLLSVLRAPREWV
jgi:coproporphyrinogen III oxidase